MSYCRFGRDSDVYVYEAADGIECCGCRLLDTAFFTAAGPAKMLEHLLAHRAAGHACRSPRCTSCGARWLKRRMRDF